MHQNLFKALFLLKYNVIKPNLIKTIKRVWQNQYMSKDQLMEMQQSKVKNILNHAYNNTLFYKRKFDEAGFHPDFFHDLKDIEKIPILKKEEIKSRGDSMMAKNLPEMRAESVNTGGTTGIPMKLYRDAGAKDLMTALYSRTRRLYGCDIGTKTAWIWGLAKPEEYRDFRQNNFKLQFLKNTAWFNAFDMTAKSMSQFARFSFQFKAELIIGYVSSLFELALFFKANNLKLYTPKAIWLTAEPVDNVQRRTIESVFKCPTFSQYGSSEILHIATECSAHQGLHIHADSRYVEVIDSKGNSSGPDEIGYIVVTDLENYVMPIIRYKNDDMSSFMNEQGCDCGSTFPKLNPIVGRVYNVFKLRSGKQIYGHMFSKKMFNYVKEIQQFQIHQTSYEEVDVFIVPGIVEDRSNLIKELQEYFESYTGKEVRYNFHFVDNIEREKSGKLLYTKSDVK